MEHSTLFSTAGLPRGEITHHDDGFLRVTTDGTPYLIPKYYHNDNAFTFENEDLRDIVLNCDPGNTALTQQMKGYSP